MLFHLWGKTMAELPAWALSAAGLLLGFLLKDRFVSVAKTDHELAREIRKVIEKIGDLAVSVAKLETIVNRIDRIESRLDNLEKQLRDFPHAK